MELHHRRQGVSSIDGLVTLALTKDDFVIVFGPVTPIMILTDVLVDVQSMS